MRASFGNNEYFSIPVLSFGTLGLGLATGRVNTLFYK